MEIEILLSTMNLQKNTQALLQTMNIKDPTLIINQEEGKQEETINQQVRVITVPEKGLSKSRNYALEKATGDICLLADDNMWYVNNVEEIVKKAYKTYPKADVIIFFIEGNSKERKIRKLKPGKIGKIRILRVISGEISFKRKIMLEKGIQFDVRFGSGATFPMGEENIFLKECINKGLKIYSYPVKIAEKDLKKSKWFTGYHKEYLMAEGACLKRMYPHYYKLMILQFALRKRKQYQFSIKEAILYMRKGAKDFIEKE